MGTNPIRTVSGKYADYWKANFEDAYASETTTPKAGVALAVVTEGHNKAKTWKKYKGSCTYCGKQGHKAVDCHAKARMVAGQRTPTPRNANRNNNNGSHNPPNQGRGGQNRNSQTPRMETRRCNGCNQVGHLIRNCPNVTGTSNQGIENAFVGHVEYEEETETRIDSIKSTTWGLPQVQIKLEDFDEYVRMPSEDICEWGGETIAHIPPEINEEQPPTSEFASMPCYTCNNSDDNSENIGVPKKNDKDEKNDNEYNSDDDKKPAPVMKTSKNYCIVCNVKYARTANGMRYCAGCIHLDHSRKTGQMGTTLCQCDRCKNWGPSWHKCHYCPQFSEKSDFDRLSYSQIHFDDEELSESPASGIEQLNFQRYIMECRKMEEGYKRQLLNQWGSPDCAKWYCHNCMTFEKKEALSHCQTCGTLRPDFTKSGKHDPDCFWSI